MTTNETTTDPTAWRPAEGERCDCGQPARTVFVTERWGNVPYCGVPHAGDHPGEALDESARSKWGLPSETGERIVVIPEVTIPATNAATAQRVHELLAEVAPMLDELHAAALELREEYHRALIQLYPYLGGGYDEVHELAGKVTGWSEVWTKIMDVIGDRFDPDGGELDHQGLTNDQIAERAAALGGAR